MDRTFPRGRDGLDPKEMFHALVRRHFHGTPKPPFNEAKRAEAGLPPDFHWPLTGNRRFLAEKFRGPRGKTPHVVKIVARLKCAG